MAGAMREKERGRRRLGAVVSGRIAVPELWSVEERELDARMRD